MTIFSGYGIRNSENVIVLTLLLNNCCGPLNFYEYEVTVNYTNITFITFRTIWLCQTEKWLIQKSLKINKKLLVKKSFIRQYFNGRFSNFEGRYFSCFLCITLIEYLWYKLNNLVLTFKNGVLMCSEGRLSLPCVNLLRLWVFLVINL